MEGGEEWDIQVAGVTFKSHLLLLFYGKRGSACTRMPVRNLRYPYEERSGLKSRAKPGRQNYTTFQCGKGIRGITLLHSPNTQAKMFCYCQSIELL
jgi:hypothetical protein